MFFAHIVPSRGKRGSRGSFLLKLRLRSVLDLRSSAAERRLLQTLLAGGDFFNHFEKIFQMSRLAEMVDPAPLTETHSDAGRVIHGHFHELAGFRVEGHRVEVAGELDVFHTLTGEMVHGFFDKPSSEE